MAFIRDRWSFVRVSGPSMVPTLRASDLVLIRRRSRVRPGDVVIARFRDLPDQLVIKRTGRPEDGGWLIYSDNEFAAGDSRQHGVADVEGRAICRLVRGWPRRLGARPDVRVDEVQPRSEA